MKSNIKVLNLLTSGGVGGIEVLCREISSASNIENGYCFLFGEGLIYEQMKKDNKIVYSFGVEKLSIEKKQKLQKIAKDYNIIVIHHDDPFLQMYYLGLMKAYPKKKYISMVHHCYDPVADNLGYGIIKRNVKSFLLKRMFAKSDRIIFVSSAGYESYVAKYSINKSKVEIVYNGISENKINEGAKIEKKKDSIIHLSYVGRLVELKGVEDLIDVLPRLIKEYNCFLDIVGDGKIRAKLEEKVRKFDLNKRVVFHGFKDDVTEYLKNADIFIYPSKTEIFGISLVEAMSYKCICVANNVGGIPEIIKNKINGFLNFDNSVDGLYLTMCEAIDAYKNEAYRERIMTEARMTACRFTISKTIEDLENIYLDVLES